MSRPVRHTKKMLETSQGRRARGRGGGYTRRQEASHPRPNELAWISLSSPLAAISSSLLHCRLGHADLRNCFCETLPSERERHNTYVHKKTGVTRGTAESVPPRACPSVVAERGTTTLVCSAGKTKQNKTKQSARAIHVQLAKRTPWVVAFHERQAGPARGL